MRVEQNIEEAQFLWGVLNQEGIKQKISPVELKKRTGVTTNVINNKNVFFKLFEGLGIKVKLVNFSIKLDNLKNLKSIPFEELNNVHFANQKRKEALQKSLSKGEGLHILDENGNDLFLPMSMDIVLKKVFPFYLEEIAKKEPAIRQQFTEIEGELRDYLHQKHKIPKIGENRFLKWFYREIDQTKLHASGMLIIAPDTTYYHWSFDLHEFTSEIIQKHLDDYCKYVNEELKKLPPVDEGEVLLKNIGDTVLKLTHPQISLLYIYSKKTITKTNAQDIAEKYLQTSGEKLFREYQRLNRTLADRTTSKNAIKDIEKVIELLRDSKDIERAKDELKAAKRFKDID